MYIIWFTIPKPYLVNLNPRQEHINPNTIYKLFSNIKHLKAHLLEINRLS